MSLTNPEKCVIFNVGDKVRNLLYPDFGIGTIISTTDTTGTRPISVEWENLFGETTYNRDGTQASSEIRLRKITKLELALM